MNRLRFAALAFVLPSVVAFGAACSPPAPPAATNTASPQLPEGAIALVHVDPAMMPSIHVDPVGQRTVPRQLRTTGKVQLDEDHVARLLAPVAGQITGLRVNVGDTVHRGDSLCSLISRDAANAIEDHIDAHRDLDLAEKTLTMTQDLYDHQAASKIALQQAQNDVAKAHARVTRTEDALTSMGLKKDEDLSHADPRVPILSPIDGVVLDRHANEGQFVQPDPNPLITIADLSTVWIDADVFERDLRLVRVGQSAEVAAAAYPDEQFHARVDRVSSVLDPTTHTARVRFVVANGARHLKPEMFAAVSLAVDDTEQALTIPASAILNEGDRTFVYVVVDEHTFARRAIETAPETADTRRVVSGLKAGDRVVTSGTVLLRAQEDRNAG